MKREMNQETTSVDIWVNVAHFVGTWNQFALPGEVYFLYCNSMACRLVVGYVHHTGASPANVCEPVISSAWVPRFHDCLQMLYDLDDKVK